MTRGEDTDRVELSVVLERCAALVSVISKLPAVPTLDWCDRAAQALLAIVANGDAGVMLIDVDWAGQVRRMLASGTASIRSGMIRGTSEAARIAIGSLEGSHSAFGELAVGKHDESPATLGGVIRRDDAAFRRQPWVGFVDAASSPTASVHGLLWAGARVYATESRPVMVAYVTALDDAALDASNAALLQTGVSVLAKLARQAMLTTKVVIGDHALEEIQWLTPREQDVLELLVEGKSVREISDHLERSPHTVHDYVKSLHRKLGASSRGELVARVLGHMREPDRDGTTIV